MKKAVLFDFDGTIVDTQLLYDIAASEALYKVDKKYDFKYCSDYFNGRGWKDVFTEIKVKEPEKDVESILQDAMSIAKDLTSRHTKPNENIFFILDNLLERDIKFAICSNSKRAAIEKKLKIANLEKYFEREKIFTFEAKGNAKPKPDIYFEAIEFFNISKADALIIEDSMAGIMAGINAEVETLLYTGGGHHTKNPDISKNILETLKSSYIKGTINDLKEIVNFIK